MQERRGGWLRRTPDTPSEATAAEPQADPEPASEGHGPRTSTIEPDWEVEGELRMEGPLLVLGDFKGAIDCTDVVTIGDGGSVQGPIHARRVLIFGGVVGDVSATRDVVLHASAKLHGDVETPSLVVERGAFFSGRSQMVQSPVARPLAEGSAETSPRQTSPASA